MLKKGFWLVLLMSLMGAAASLRAQELAQSAVTPLATVRNGTEIGGAHTLYATYAKYNNTTTRLDRGYQALDDATTITCPGPHACLIEDDEFANMGDEILGNEWSICFALDGVYVSTPNCPVQEAQNGYENGYQVGSFVQFAGNVSPGTHTVQTFVNSTAGVTESTWSLIYRVYEP